MRKTHTTVAVAAVTALALVAGDALAKRPDNPGKPDKPEKPASATYGKARGPLVRDTADSGKGRIDVQRRRNGSDLRIMGQKLDPDTAVDIVMKRLKDPPPVDELEDPYEQETLADGVRTNDEGSVKLMIRTRKGDDLPFEAESLDDLAGYRVCIRVETLDDDGDDLLVGTVPLIGADYPKRLREKDDLTPVDDVVTCTGKIQLRFRGKDVRSELRIDVKGLTDGDDVSFRMDDGEGNIVEIGTAVADAEGEARYRVRTHHGDTLPFGALTVMDLSGRDVEVWVNPEFYDPDLDDPDNPLVERGRCLTGTVPGDPPAEE
jgi:hypothetical protein